MMNGKVNLILYKNTLTCRNKLLRLSWNCVWTIFARPFPRAMACGWKRFLLRGFGAKIDSTAVIYSTSKIYYPPNLVMKEHSCLASGANCYNVDRVTIGANSIVSQGAYLCTASHDITSSSFPLITAPIVIEDQVWIAADAFVGMGVTIKQGAVVGARAVIFKDVEPWSIVIGNPAKFVKKRIILK